MSNGLPQKSWRNWGDHPFVVMLSALGVAATIFQLSLQLSRDQEQEPAPFNPQPVVKPKPEPPPPPPLGSTDVEELILREGQSTNALNGRMTFRYLGTYDYETVYADVIISGQKHTNVPFTLAAPRQFGSVQISLDQVDRLSVGVSVPIYTSQARFKLELTQ